MSVFSNCLKVSLRASEYQSVWSERKFSSELHRIWTRLELCHMALGCWVFFFLLNWTEWGSLKQSGLCSLSLVQSKHFLMPCEVTMTRQKRADRVTFWLLLSGLSVLSHTLSEIHFIFIQIFKSKLSFKHDDDDDDSQKFYLINSC